MAMQKCKECNNQVSSKADTCPHCGAPLKRKTSVATGCLGVLVGFVILVAVIGGMSGGGSSSSSTSNKDWKSKDNSSMAYIMMEDFVEKRLKSPSTAEFPGVWDGKLDHVTPLKNQTYRIESYVDAQNSFGATVRTRFVGEIKQTSKDTWRLQSLTLLE